MTNRSIQGQLSLITKDFNRKSVSGWIEQQKKNKPFLDNLVQNSKDSTGEFLRDQALEQVESNAEDWFSLAMITLANEVRWLPAEFSGEDIRTVIKQQIGEPSNLNAWGALIMRAVRNKLIEPTGKLVQSTNRKSHARALRTYRVS